MKKTQPLLPTMSVASATSLPQLFDFWVRWFDKQERVKNMWPMPFRTSLTALMIKLQFFQNREDIKSDGERVKNFLFLFDKIPKEYYESMKARESLENLIVAENLDNFHMLLGFLKKKQFDLSATAYINLFTNDLNFDSMYKVEPQLKGEERKRKEAQCAHLIEQNHKEWNLRAQKAVALASLYQTPITWAGDYHYEGSNYILEGLKDSEYPVLEFLCSESFYDIDAPLQTIVDSALPPIFKAQSLKALKDFENIALSSKKNKTNHLSENRLQILKSVISKKQIEAALPSLPPTPYEPYKISKSTQEEKAQPLRNHKLAKI